jgi:hypothetical protein
MTKKASGSFIYGKKTARTQTAKGVRGFILSFNSTLCFRVYSKDKRTFTDYDLSHNDLEVTIQDGNASFYTFGERGSGVLDYSPGVLGLKPSSGSKKERRRHGKSL